MEVLRALSRRGEALSLKGDVLGTTRFSYAVDGIVLTRFDPRVPALRQGGQPDALSPLMREVGLDPNPSGNPLEHAVLEGEAIEKSMALAEQITGTHVDSSLLHTPLMGVGIAPLLDAPSTAHGLEQIDREVAAAVDVATPAAQREVASSVARRLAELAGTADLPPIAEALDAAASGEARDVTDETDLGRLIRSWDALANAARLHAEPTSAGSQENQPDGITPRLGSEWQALASRWRAGLAIRSALYADAHTAVGEVLTELLAHWPGVRPAGERQRVLDVLRGRSH